MKIFKQLFVSCLLLLFCQTLCAAPMHLPARPEGYVSDYAHLLTPAQNQSLTDTLRQFDQKTSNQIVVATFNSLNGDSLDDFSIHLAEAWKIGTKQSDNGVLLLIIKDSHDIRIEVGYGLEGVLTDAVSSVIIRQEIAPSFKQGDYNQGIQNGVQAIMQVTQGSYKGTGSTPGQTNLHSHSVLFFIVLFLIIHFISAIFRYRSIRGTHKDKGWWTFLFFLLLSNNSSRRSGGGGDDGGFTGGGGGFGGGGASGKW